MVSRSRMCMRCRYEYDSRTYRGSTIHSFGDVPIGDEQASANNEKCWGEPDVIAMFIKCENMRVLIVDEGSFCSCESLSTTELNVRTATHDAAETYKVRHGKRRDAKEVRTPGGLNVRFFVDRWQFPPVRQIATNANPFEPKQRVCEQS